MSKAHTDELVVADIGGTHARFAIAHNVHGECTELSHLQTLRTADYDGLESAWQNYTQQIDRELPQVAAIAAAARIRNGLLTFTNSSWTLQPEVTRMQLGLKHLAIINDFGAVSHAAAQARDSEFASICGPEKNALNRDGVVTVIGPGTGLGVAQIVRQQGQYSVTETEGGHIAFAPQDAVEDRILAALRDQHERVSAERVVAGSGLGVIYRVLAEMEGQAMQELDDKTLWALALSGEDDLAAAALDRYCQCLGSVIGDIALAQGAHSVVLAGGLGARIGNRLAQSGFCERFQDKGRFRWLMEEISVKRLLVDEPGLQGAAAAYREEYVPCAR